MLFLTTEFKTVLLASSN